MPAPGRRSTDALNTVAFDGTNALPPRRQPRLDFGTWRGAFLVGNTVYYGYTDGYLYSRSFDGNNARAGRQVDPYNDPFWSDVDSDDGTTTGARCRRLYGQLPNVTGMAYDAGPALLHAVR